MKSRICQQTGFLNLRVDKTQLPLIFVTALILIITSIGYAEKTGIYKTVSKSGVTLFPRFIQIPQPPLLDSANPSFARTLPKFIDFATNNVGKSIDLSLLSSFLSLRTNMFIQTQTNESVNWTNGVGVSISGNSLTKAAAFGWGNAGASSTRAISAGDGYVEFTATEANSSRMCGLSVGDNDQTFQDIDYAIYIAYDNTVSIYEAGNYISAASGTYSAGNRFRIAVESGVVNYYNLTKGQLIYSSKVKPVYPLSVDTALAHTGATLTDVTLSGVLQNAPQNVVWTKNTTNIAVTGNSLKKSAMNNPAWDAGAVSTRALYSDGFVDFIASEANTDRVAGFSYRSKLPSYGDVMSGYGAIDFGIRQSYGYLYIVESNATTTGISVGAYTAGDRLRISVENGVVRYWQFPINQSLPTKLLAESQRKPIYPLAVNACLYDPNSTVNTAALSGTLVNNLSIPQSPYTGTPYNNSPLTIPGIVETEQFDNGGETTAYNDTMPNNQGQNYDVAGNPPATFRSPTDVDIYEYSGYSSGKLVLMQAGDWMNYTVNVTNAGTYTLQAQVAWGSTSGTLGSFHIEVDGLDKTGAIQIPDTGWAFQLLSKPGIQLAAGQHIVRLVADTNASNGSTGDIDYLSFLSAKTPTPTVTPTPTITPTPTATPTITPTPTATPTPGTPKVNPISVIASNSASGSLPSYAVDGNLSTSWNSGNYPQQWIQLDLGQIYAVSQIRLNISQVPNGQTTHEIYGGPNPESLVLLRTLNGTTQSEQWLELAFSPGADNIRYLRIVTNTSPSWVAWSEIEIYGNPSLGGVNNFSAKNERLDPVNETGETGEDLLSGNFNFSLPVVGLAGRSGLDLGLELTYNSLVWTKSGSSVYFNADNGNPAPGFRLGFPTIQSKYFSTQANKYAYLLITPSGSRVELRQVGNTNTYESADSSYLQLSDNNSDNSLIMKTSDGTQLTFGLGGLGDWLCIKIRDRNGNLITVNYNANGTLNFIIDTAGRVITFNYLSGNLNSITQPWTVGGSTVTHTWAKFDYKSQTIQTNFVNSNGGVLTVKGPQNNQSINVLSNVTLADSSSFDFSYTSWGQIYQIKKNAPDGHTLLSYTSYNLPVDNSTAQQDCPRFTERHDWAQNWNGDTNGVGAASEEAVTKYSIALNSGVGTVTMPSVVYNSSTSIITSEKEYFATESWKRGLPVKTETYSNNVLMRTVTTEWTQDDESLPYQVNPRPKETKSFDLQMNQRRTTFHYATFGLPDEVEEFGSTTGTAETLLRRSETDYKLEEPYLSRRIIGLPKEQRIKDANGSLLSKQTFDYDLGGEYLVSQGTPTQYEDVGYIERGNLCRVNNWDVKSPSVNDPSDIAKALKSETGYNRTGSVIFTRDSQGHTAKISYADSNNGNTSAYPTMVTPPVEGAESPASFSSKTEYNYDMGLPTVVTNPKGAILTNAYDSLTGRLQKTSSNNGGYTRFVYSPNGMQLDSYTLLDTGVEEEYSGSISDGAGRTIQSISKLPGSQDSYRGQKSVYDVLGRFWKQSNPIEIGSDWNPAGIDKPETGGTGWVYSEQRYDWNGRPTDSINVEGTKRTISYTDVAGGEQVITTDELGRQQRTMSDVLGRVMRSEVLKDGNVYSSMTTDYNELGQVRSVEQFKTGVYNNGYCPTGVCQQTAMTYDGYGRLESKKLPIQENPTTSIYNSDGTVYRMTDAQGATATYTYNVRGQVKKIVYRQSVSSSSTTNRMIEPPTPDPSVTPTPGVTPSATVTPTPGVTPSATVTPTPGVSPTPMATPDTPTVEFDYDVAGNRKWMTDGLGRVDYDYDTWSRLKNERRRFNINGVSNPSSADGSYTISYGYNLAGMLKNITDPFNSTINYTYDSAGQLTDVKGAAPFAGITNYATGITYRAWGATSHIDYGNSRKLDITYNKMLQPNSYTIPGVMQKTYEYYSDGMVKSSTDGLDNRFDRSYKYDHVGRVIEALSGAESRGGAATNDRPYKQTFEYDEQSHIVKRPFYRIWTQNKNDTYDLTFRGGRSTTWQYDKNGNLMNTNSILDGVQYDYNTAGQTVHTHSNQSDVTQSFDGDGQVVKRIITDYVNRDSDNQPVTGVSYNIHSSLLGQDITELRTDGKKARTFVYAGGKVLAWQLQNSDGSQYVGWEHRDPSNASFRETGTNLSGSANSAELDTLSMNAGTINSFQDPRSEYTRYPDFGNAMLKSPSGCLLDHLEKPCDVVNFMMKIGIAVQCPYNNCMITVSKPPIQTNPSTTGGGGQVSFNQGKNFGQGYSFSQTPQFLQKQTPSPGPCPTNTYSNDPGCNYDEDHPYPDDRPLDRPGHSEAGVELLIQGINNQLHHIEIGAGKEIWNTVAGASNGLQLSTNPCATITLVGLRCPGGMAYQPLPELDASNKTQIWTMRYVRGALFLVPIGGEAKAAEEGAVAVVGGLKYTRPFSKIFSRVNKLLVKEYNPAVQETFTEGLIQNSKLVFRFPGGAGTAGEVEALGAAKRFNYYGTKNYGVFVRH